jgi:Sigma-70, region 4
VNWLKTHRVAADTTSQCATYEDFRKLFTEDVRGLHLLSFLLTADYEKAERCFVAGLDECVDGDSVFKEWARPWALRMIVRNAVQMISPHPGAARSTPSTFCSAGKAGLAEIALEDGPFARVLALDDFERFVYVLSVLEGYPVQDCAALLGTSQQTVEETRVRALQHIADTERLIAAPMNGSSSMDVS